jgi:hypothetical protein
MLEWGAAGGCVEDGVQRGKSVESDELKSSIHADHVYG